MNELTYERKEKDEKGRKNKPLAFKSQRFVSRWLEDGGGWCTNTPADVGVV